MDQVVQTKINVGANKNQAFVEFQDVTQAMSMIQFFGTSPDPAQVWWICFPFAYVDWLIGNTFRTSESGSKCQIEKDVTTSSMLWLI